MARITVEDCIDKFSSRFELVLVAANRARKLHAGENPTVEKDNDKNTVIALREIADETITNDVLKNDLVEEYQTLSNIEEEDNVSDEEQNMNALQEQGTSNDETTSVNNAEIDQDTQIQSDDDQSENNILAQETENTLSEIDNINDETNIESETDNDLSDIETDKV